MEKSGQRVAYPEIIDRPELRSRLRNITEVSITVFLWLLWLAWILPLAVSFLCLWDIKYLYVVTSQAYISQLQRILAGTVAAVSCIFAVMSLWIGYNRTMVTKRKGERRKEPRKCSDKTLALHFHVDAGVLRIMRECSTLNVSLKGNELILPPLLPDHPSGLQPQSKGSIIYTHLPG